MKIDFNFLTGRENNFLKEYEDQKLHTDALTAFKKLKNDAKREANIELGIISSFRDFNRQEYIWNRKVLGERKIFDDFENEVNLDTLSPIEIINAITRFSAIPGTSRHHWGTDIDIFDKSVCSVSDVRLWPSEYASGGVFSNLSTWLATKIDTGESHGFYLPYKTDLGGVHPEAWHLSYAPISNDLHMAYTLEIFEQNLSLSDFKLSDILLENAKLYFKKLLININPLPQM